MNEHLLSELERTYKQCSDCLMHPEHIALLEQLRQTELSQALIDWLCEKSVSRKQGWELRFHYLRILLLNPSAMHFDLKSFYLENVKKCRRLALRLFFIRGYAAYASREELETVMKPFCKSIENNHDYIDYNYMLSAAGLPYLVNTYGYHCFTIALQKAEEEHQKIHPLLKGYFTINEELRFVALLPGEEAKRRGERYLKEVLGYGG